MSDPATDTAPAETVVVNPGFRLLTTEVVPLTEEIATEFRDLTPSPTERELNIQRVAHLRQKVLHGMAIPFHWDKASLKGTTTMVRMNGQHSSAMLCELNGAFPKDGKIVLSHWEVDDEKALALLFRQFDDRKSGRTPTDVAGAYQGLYPDLHELPRDVGKQAVEAFCWWRDQVEGLPSVSGDDRYELFRDEGLRRFSLWVNDILSSKTPELKKTTVISAIYASWRANTDAATEFWDLVARGGDDTNERDPTTVLDAWLKGLHENRRAARDVKPAQLYQGCAFAWNTFRAGREISSIKYDTKKGLHAIAE